MFTATKAEVGVREFLDVVAEFLPSPVTGLHRKLIKDDGEEEIKPDVSAGPFIAQVFKVWIEPKSNIKYSFFRVHSGSAAAEVAAQVDDERKGQRLGHILKFQGADHADVDQAMAGDIVGVAKLDLHIGQVLHTGTPGKIALPKFPSPMNSVAVEPKARGDEVKINEALGKLADMDPCFKTSREQQTAEMVVSGMGDLHLRVMLSRMARFSKVEVNTKPPKIPYRETISAKADGHYRHKKQTGGSGQFGEVYLTVEPIARGSNPPWSGTGRSSAGRSPASTSRPSTRASTTCSTWAPSPATRCRTSRSASPTASTTRWTPRKSPSASPASSPCATPSPRPSRSSSSRSSRSK